MSIQHTNLNISLVISLAIASTIGIAYAASGTDKQIISIYNDLDEMCRGWPGDGSHTGSVCVVRDKLGKVLEESGYCYGKDRQSEAESQWHKCSPNR
jgi:hypothetical protein